MDISVQRTLHSQRHTSVFPPLLRSNGEQEARSTHGYNQIIENEKIKKSAGRAGHLASRTGTLTTECVLRERDNGQTKKMTSGNQREEELRKKKHERAEALVKKWDSLQVKDKEEKYSRLLQRLELQHKLIAKNDLLYKQLEKEAEERHMKELQSQRDFKRQMMQELRDHNKRVNEHKRMVAEKMRESEIFRPVFHINPNPSPELNLRGHHEESAIEEDTPYHSDSRPSSRRGPSRLQQLLHFDPIREATPTIPVAWKTLMHDNERRMLPFLEHSIFTRKFASPTSRHLLRYYDQPVQINSKSGERVPLLELMDKESREQQTGMGVQSILTNALELKAHRNQAKAEALLLRKQAQVDVPIQEPTMYLPKDEYAFMENTTQLQNQLERHPLETVSVKPIPIDRHTKKRLPKYLVNGGTLVSGTLEQIGERIYCRPAIGNPTETTNASKPTILNAHNQEMTTTASTSVSRWQPLSTSAALEYEGTHAVPVKAFSGLGHAMWKPLSSHTSYTPNV